MTAVAFEAFALDLADPLETARGTVERREGFLVSVETEGERGVGEATPLPGWTESLGECRAALERAAAVAERDGLGAALPGPRDTPAARHGLELALADTRARAADEPLYRNLGADARVERVPVNATVGDAAPEPTAGAAEAAVAGGFDCLKVKVGSRSVTADVERLRAVRERVGSDVELRADANGAWDRERARAAFDALADVDVAYVEQPLPASDLAGHAALRGGSVGVAVDETLATAPIEDVLAANAADAFVCKPMALGGPVRAREMALRAREAGVEPIVTTTVDAVVARTAAVHVAASLPDVAACGLATADLLAGDIAPDPAPVKDGRIRVPQGKGNGVADPRPT